MLGHVDQVELLTALHAGVYETPPWQTFIERLRRRMRADRCWLMIGSDDPDRPNHDWLAAAPGLAGCEATKSVPAMIRSARQRPGRLYAGVDLMALLPDRSLWPDLFDRHWRTVRVTGAGELSGWIAVTRSSEDFSAADGATLTALVPHLAVALQTKEVLEDQRRRATLGEMLLDRVGLGWAWVGTDGEIGAASPVARNILANGGRHLQPDGADAIRCCSTARALQRVRTPIVASPCGRQRRISGCGRSGRRPSNPLRRTRCCSLSVHRRPSMARRSSC